MPGFKFTDYSKAVKDAKKNMAGQPSGTPRHQAEGSTKEASESNGAGETPESAEGRMADDSGDNAAPSSTETSESKGEVSGEGKEPAVHEDWTEVQKHLVRDLIFSILLFVGVIACMYLVAGFLARSLMVENLVSLFGLVIGSSLLMPFYSLLSRLDAMGKPEQALKSGVLALVLIYVTAAVLFSIPLLSSLFSSTPGKNANTGNYHHFFTDFGKKDLDALIQKKCAGAEGTQVAAIDLDDYHEVFYLSGDEVTSYEFSQEYGRYFYLGTRKLQFEEGRHADSATWQKTVYADAKASRLAHHVRLFHQGDSDPAWGVTETDPENTLQINGETPDIVVPLKMEDGSTAYLWIYKDLGNTKKLVPGDVAFENK